MIVEDKTHDERRCQTSTNQEAASFRARPCGSGSLPFFFRIRILSSSAATSARPPHLLFFPPPLPPIYPQSHHKRRQSHHLLPPSPRSKVAHSRITFPPSSFSRNPSRLLAKRTDALGSRANSSSSSCSSAATSSAKCDFLKPPSKPPWLSLIAIRLSASHVFRLQHHQHKDDDTLELCTQRQSLYNIYKRSSTPGASSSPQRSPLSLAPSGFPEITSRRAHAAPPCPSHIDTQDTN